MRFSADRNSRPSQGLLRQNRLLKGVNEAIQQLLSIADFDEAIKAALEKIATAAEIDFLFIYQHHVDAHTQHEFATCLYEWLAPGLSQFSQRAQPGQLPELYEAIDNVSDCLVQLKAGNPVQALRADLSAARQRQPENTPALSTLMLPITIGEAYWGILGVDDDTTEQVWNNAEVAILKTAATYIGKAIERDRTLQEQDAITQRRIAELDAHNQVLAKRDHILEATAAAANVMLTAVDFNSSVCRALKIIGEGLDADRVNIGQYFPPTPETPMGYHRFSPYEWVSVNTSIQAQHPELAEINDQGVEFIVEQLRRGEIFIGIVEELPEPFRSGQLELGAKSTYAIPISVNGSYWGILAFDDCRRITHRSDAELEALKTLASCIGNAIERDRNRTEREDASSARATELETYNQQLQQRDNLLNCVNEATQCLVACDDLAVALPTMLRILGEGTRQCRAYILKITRDAETNERIFNLSLEWDAPHIPPKEETGGKFPVPISRFPDRLTAPLKAGKVTQFLARELDGIAPDDRLPGQARALVGVPIMINGDWWGLLGLDDCIEERVWSDAEITVLETAATAVGNAVERNYSRKAREAAERTALIESERAARAAELEATNKILTTRDRWLETTAAATNVLLSATNVSTSVDAALQTIGENLECDRVFVFQFMTRPSASADDPSYAQLTHEWFSEGLEPHIDIPEIAEISGERFQYLNQQIMSQQWLGGIVDELPEPLRNYQQSLGVKSVYVVPVFINGEPWGVVGINHCYQAKRLSLEEIGVFKTAATCIGSAIYQETVRRDQAAQERARLLDSVAEVANLLLRSTDYTTVLPEVVRLLGEAVECDRCGIGQDISHPISGQAAVEVRPEWEWRTPTTLSASFFSPHDDGLYSWDDGPFLTAQMRQGVAASYLVADLPEKDRLLMNRQGATATLFVPITVGQMLWGFIHFDSNRSEPRLYGEVEISILRVAAESIAAAIARQAQDEALRKSEQAILAEREKAAQERAAELSKTNEVIGQSLSTLTSNPELDKFLIQLLSRVSKQINAHEANLFLYDEATDALSKRITIQGAFIYKGAAPSDPELFKQPFPTHTLSIWEMLLSSTKPLTLDTSNPEVTQLYWPESVPDYASQDSCSTVCAIMKVGNKPIGLISFAFRKTAAVTDEQLEFIQALINQATLAIHLTALAKENQSSVLTAERNRLAREIHDTLAQAFTGVSLQLEAVRGLASQATHNPNAAPQILSQVQIYIRRARDLARQGLSEARRSVLALRSEALETDELPEALRKVVAAAAHNTNLQTYFYLEGQPASLSDDLQLNLLRIAQEAITNTIRHSQATQLDMTLTFMEDYVRLRIADNGVGFDTASLLEVSGFGLVGIRERADRLGGTFELHSTLGVGTTLSIIISLHQPL
ncbi:MAG: GAF domain-containing protein [Cyanobacteria bacterium J06633_2]